jgi:hypothetical protein
LIQKTSFVVGLGFAVVVFDALTLLLLLDEVLDDEELDSTLEEDDVVSVFA